MILPKLEGTPGTPPVYNTDLHGEEGDLYDCHVTRLGPHTTIPRLRGYGRGPPGPWTDGSNQCLGGGVSWDPEHRTHPTGGTSRSEKDLFSLSLGVSVSTEVHEKSWG